MDQNEVLLRLCAMVLMLQHVQLDYVVQIGP